MEFVTDVQRYKLVERARLVFKEEADILMAHLPVGGNNSVMKTDVFKVEMANLRTEIRDGFSKLFFSIAGLNIAIFGLLLASIKWL